MIYTFTFHNPKILICFFFLFRLMYFSGDVKCKFFFELIFLFLNTAFAHLSSPDSMWISAPKVLYLCFCFCSSSVFPMNFKSCLWSECSWRSLWRRGHGGRKYQRCQHRTTLEAFPEDFRPRIVFLSSQIIRIYGISASLLKEFCYISISMYM